MYPSPDCALCPRLVGYRRENRSAHPDWHNAPALPFGDLTASLLIVGLAPGRLGANRTGRVFTGDVAGRILFQTLVRTGFATGNYSDDGQDNMQLHDCLITNAVMCAPPGNRPLPAEESACRPHLAALIAAMPKLRTLVTLGEVARKNTLKALNLSPSKMANGHGAELHTERYFILNSYHCSRLNINTGRLTEPMFEAIFRRAKTYSPSQ